MKKYLTSILILCAFLFSINKAISQIPASVKNTLTQNLEAISIEWVQESVNSANSIFTNYQNEPVSEWVTYFDNYFATRNFTQGLRDYLGYPTFFWLSNQTRTNLQSSLNTVFQANILDAINTPPSVNEEKISLQLKFHFLGSYFVSDIPNTSNYHESIADFCINLANNNPNIFNKNNYVDVVANPYLGNIRVQLHGILASYNYYNTNKHVQIEQALGINTTSSPYQKSLWDDFGVIVSDNGIYNDLRFEKTHFVFSQTPSNMHRVVLITTSGVTSNYAVERVGGFNTFNTAIGVSSENSFPIDIEAHEADSAILVLCHELAHNLDSYGLDIAQPYLSTYRDQILAAAGNEQLNYLRSMFNVDFFTNAPQEFIASVGNQFYSNTERTLELAKLRFQNGYTQPINQFLLFANMMTGGTNALNFFKFDTNANFDIETKTVEKNQAGFITKINISENCYYLFVLDNNNFVTDILSSLDCDTSSTEAYTLIPDQNFEQALIDLGIDNIIDGKVLTANVVNVTVLAIWDKNIAELTGIEDFAALTYLDVNNNQLTSIDVSNNTALTDLYFSDNQVTNINISGNPNLEVLQAYNNQLTSIDVNSNVNLTKIDAYSNQLTSLDVSNNITLTYLDVNFNQLTNLDVTSNLNLESLWCYNNQLTTIDISNNIALTGLNIGVNQLTNLDISNNNALTYLRCNNNQLTTLDVSTNTDLTYLRCDNNQLTTLDVSTNNDLTYLGCNNNEITNLDVSNNIYLVQLFCYHNQLSSLDVTNNPNLVDLWCYNNQLTSLDVRNGNNAALSTYTEGFKTTNNPNLACIFVDDAAYSTINWTNIDANSIFVNNEAECTTLDIEESTFSFEFSVYPNPSRGSSKIDLARMYSNVHIQVLDVLGKTVDLYNYANTKDITLNTSNYSKGLYFIQIKTPDNSATLKLLVD